MLPMVPATSGDFLTRTFRSDENVTDREEWIEQKKRKIDALRDSAG